MRRNGIGQMLHEIYKMDILNFSVVYHNIQIGNLDNMFWILLFILHNVKMRKLTRIKERLRGSKIVKERRISWR